MKIIIKLKNLSKKIWKLENLSETNSGVARPFLVGLPPHE